MNTILLFGGTSRERLVSVASAQNLALNLTGAQLLFIDPSGALYRVTAESLLAHQNPFEKEFKPAGEVIAPSLAAATAVLKGNVVFNALHGGEGENGTVQGILEQQRVPYTGSSSTASALCMDKRRAKQRVADAGIAIAKEFCLPSHPDEAAVYLQEKLNEGITLLVKPVDDGSSFGLSILGSQQSLTSFLASESFENVSGLLVEEFVTGREITVGIIEVPPRFATHALPPSEVVLDAGYTFDYSGKYLGKGSTELTPAPLTHDETVACQQLAKRAHEVLGCRGYSRTDMILTAQGPIFLETNTLPGLTKASFIPQQLEAEGIALDNFLSWQLDRATHGEHASLKRP